MPYNPQPDKTIRNGWKGSVDIRSLSPIAYNVNMMKNKRPMTIAMAI
jgi:hypothetical protein